MGREGVMASVLVGVVLLLAGTRAQEEEEGMSTKVTTRTTPGASLTLRPLSCSTDADCESVSEGTYCQVSVGRCACKQDYPVTDSRHCYRDSKFGEFCSVSEQCQRMDENSRCDKDLNVCACQPRFRPEEVRRHGGRQQKCVEMENPTDSSPDAYYDPALFGIMGGLALMFIVMCVVLQLFAKAQFRENRTIFNTPNPRLMNVSLMKDIGRKKKRNSSKDRSGSRAGRRESVATAATLALHVGRSSLTANAAPSTDQELVDPDNVMVLVRNKLESVDEDYDCDGHDDIEATCEILSDKEECYNGSPISV